MAALFETLSDAFNATTLNAAKWVASATTLSGSGDALVGGGWLTTVDSHDLTGSSLVIHITSADMSSGGAIFIDDGSTDSGALFGCVYGSTCYVQWRTVYDGPSASADFHWQPWLRFRQDSDGIASFDTSPDGIEWTTVITSTAPIDLSYSNLYVEPVGALRVGGVNVAAPDNPRIRRFDPVYWQVDYNTDSAATLIAPTVDSLLLTITFRTTLDLIGLKWLSIDTVDHPLARYETNFDYSTATLDFDYVSTNVRGTHEANGPTLAVNHVGGGTSYVRLSNYLTSGIPTNGHYHLEFSTVGGGWEGLDPIDWTNVNDLLISVMNNTYDNSLPVAPITEVVGTVSITNIVVAGPTLEVGDPNLPAHRLRMTDGFDDAYYMTPARIVRGMYQLGYRDWYTVYIGISHHHNVSWDAGQSRFVVDPTKPVMNTPAREWFDNLFAELAADGFTNVVISQSYEIVGYLMPDDWAQRDHVGNFGLTGWSPPSKLISPCNTDALDYLSAMMTYLVGQSVAHGCEPLFQTGEPWWWDNSFSTNAPCFYDDATVALYQAEHSGASPPTPRIDDNAAPVTGQETFLAWLGQKLGDSTLYIRDQVKATYPTAKAMVLFFTPQIYSTAIMQIANLPPNWHDPAWDILQVEDYDWVTGPSGAPAANWAGHLTTWPTAFETLGYAPADTHYFSGFVLYAADAEAMWPLIDNAIADAIAQNVAEVWVWARPQVFRDGYVYVPVPVATGGWSIGRIPLG